MTLVDTQLLKQVTNNFLLWNGLINYVIANQIQTNTQQNSQRLRLFH